eukprot:3142961-Pleurochrysis_carterae.AAC.3
MRQLLSKALVVYFRGCRRRRHRACLAQTHAAILRCAKAHTCHSPDCARSSHIQVKNLWFGWYVRVEEQDAKMARPENGHSAVSHFVLFVICEGYNDLRCHGWTLEPSELFLAAPTADRLN